MGVRSERRTMGARGGLGLLYSLGVENGSPIEWEIALIRAMGLGRVFLASESRRPS
jgi:hypothetical protein